MNSLAIGTLIVGGILFFAFGNKKELTRAAEQLTTNVSDFKIHAVDLATRTFDIKLDVTFNNPTQTVIPLSNLVVRVNLPINGQWRTLAQSTPTGKLNINPGPTKQSFRFTAPIAAEVYTLFGQFMKGNAQELQIEVFPQFAGANLNPVTFPVTVDPRQITTTLLSNAFGLGLVPNNGKKIKGNPERYNRFFPSQGQLKGTDPIVADGSTFTTLDEMKRIVRETLPQTAAIAKQLQKTRVTDTLRSVFTFANENFNYRLDTPGVEQLRQPLRSWKDKYEGIDCDCYSILISSILSNLGISHSFRKAKYNGSKQYSHIYVVAHVQGTNYVLDPVVGTFNTEHPYTKIYTEKVL